MMRLYFTGIGLLISSLVPAQPVAEFSLAAQACRAQDIGLQNQTTGASSYRWDFCYGGAETTPIGTNSTFISAGNSTEGLVIVQDGTQWYGFMANTNANTLLRLDFGTNPASNPTVVDLGNPGGLLDRPRDISLVKTNGVWLALVTCFNAGSSTTRLVRLNFGTTLNSLPSAQNLANLGGRLIQAYSVDWMADRGEWIAVIGDRSQRKILLVNFRTNPTGTPSASADFKELILPGGGFLKDVALLRDASGWNGLALIENGNVFKLEFPGGLFEVPFTINLTSQVSLTGFPNNAVLLRDVDRYFAFVLQFEGDLFRLDFGSNLSNSSPIVTNLGRLGTLANVQGLAMTKIDNHIYGYSCSIASQLKRVHFTAPCSGSAASSSLFAPAVNFNQSGTKRISLEATNDFGESRVAIESIQIKEKPTASFSFSRNCAADAAVFQDTSVDDGVILSWSWFFDDPASGAANNSNLPGPNHIFAQPGTYQVQLTVTDDCGDTDTLVRSVVVTDPASVSLAILPAGPVCSFQPVAFSPATSVGLGEVSDVQWNFGDGNSTTVVQPVHQYASANTFLVQLVARVAQCSKNATASLVVNPGVDVQFSSSGICSQQSVSFLNLSSQVGISHLWDFGDGQTSTALNPTHTYSNAGEYSVSLEIVSANGCVNQRSENKKIWSRPVPDFSLALPPFSCAGTPSQFTDLTPPPTDSNITSWSWAFGDAANGSSSQRNPAYVYTTSGSYSVTLTTTTNTGCSAFVNKTVTIAASPTATFTTGLACAGSPTQFTDTSTGIVARQWQIQSTTYTSLNPTHVFPAQGSFPVSLTVTGTNGCLNQRQQVVNVPVPIQPDFIAQNPCATQVTTFEDASSASPSDPAVNWQWNFGSLGSAQGTTASRIFPTPQNYNVQLTVTGQSGCQYTRSRTLVVNTVPEAAFVATPVAGPAPLTVDFTNTSTGATSYQWLFGDPANSQSIDISPVFTYLSLGTYPVRLVAARASGCRDTARVQINVVVPAVDLSVDRLELVLQPDGTRLPQVTLTNRSNVPIRNPDLQLQLGNMQSVVEAVVQTLQPGEQLVRFMNARVGVGQADYVCVSASTASDQIMTNDRQCVSLSDGWFLLPPHPNPASDVIWLQWTPTTTPPEVEVWNSTGQRIAELTDFESGGGQRGLDVSGWAPGVYIIQLRAEGRVEQVRVVIAR